MCISRQHRTATSPEGKTSKPSNCSTGVGIGRANKEARFFRIAVGRPTRQ